MVERKTKQSLGEAALALMLRDRRPGPFLATLVVGALAISSAICIVMSLLLHEEIRPDYLVTGTVCCLAAAPPVLGILLLVIGRLRELTAELQRLAVTDPLTQAYDRRAFESFLARETRRAARYQRPLALILLDLDHFKAVNDTHGHVVGDRVLVAAVEAIGSVLREADLLFRIGGDEFAVLLPETDLQGATEAGQRICQIQVASGDHDTPRAPVSCGVAEHQADSTPEALIEAADKQLYRAKHAGGNQVCTAGLSPESD